MHKKLLFGLIAAISATNAYSDQVLTSQRYVDDADAQKVNIAQGVGTNNANVGKTLVVNSSGNLELGTVSADNFVEDSITDGVTNKAPSENAVHDALENKQNTIATDMVDFGNDMGPLPAITTYDTTGGLVANKIGILDRETIEGDEGDLSLYNTLNYGARMDNYVPTVRAVADGLISIWNSMPNRLYWSSPLQTPINNYSTTFSSVGDTWPNNTQNYVPTVGTFANGLALKQNKIPASEWQDGYDNTIPGVIVSTDEDGVIEQRMILDKTGNITGQSIYEMVQYGEANQGITLDIHNDSVTEDDVNNAVPTTTMTIAIANAAANVNNPKLDWSSSLQTPINNYSTTFSFTSDTWPNNQQNYVPTAETLANGLALKQNKIPASETTIHNAVTNQNQAAPSVVTNTATPGVVGQMAILTGSVYNSAAVDDDFSMDDFGNGTGDDMLVTAKAVVNYVDGRVVKKQNTIATDMVDFGNDMGPLPAITTYDTTGGLVANKIGILDRETIADDEGDLSPYNTDNYGTRMDNYVPTVRAVADGLINIWNSMPNRLNWSSSLQTPINNYSMTFSSASNTWPNSQQNYLPTAETFANGLALKQNKIPAHAANAADSVLTDSTTAGVVQKRAILDMETFDENFNASDLVNMDLHNMIPDAGTVGSAIGDVAALKQNKIPAGTAGNVVTYTGTAGTVGSVGVLSSLDNYDSTTDSEKLVNAGAIVGALSESDVSNHTINGAPLSNAASVFYGTSSTAAATATKEVSIPSITTLSIGTMIIVQPSVTSTVASSSIKLNNFDAYPMRYNDAAITTSTDSVVWSAAYPSIFVFDGTYWRFVAHGYDANTTYSTMSVADGIAGTATAARTISATNAKQIIQGTTLTGIDTTATTSVIATDSITTGIGKLQGQVDTKQNKMTCTRWLNNIETDENCLLWELGN